VTAWLEHDPEKWKTIDPERLCSTNNWSMMAIPLEAIML
jgi:hypothetical protein